MVFTPSQGFLLNSTVSFTVAGNTSVRPGGSVSTVKLSTIREGIYEDLVSRALRDGVVRGCTYHDSVRVLRDTAQDY